MAPAKWKTAALAVAIVGVGIFTLALVSGILYEQSQRARDREHFPQIGRSMDIGGRMLNIDCSGTGQPAVILESGANWALNSAVHGPKTIFSNGGPRPGYSWVSIQRALATVTTVCWYDRAGSGWSDLGPYPRDICVAGSRSACSSPRRASPAALCAGGRIIGRPGCSCLHGLLSLRGGRPGAGQLGRSSAFP